MCAWQISKLALQFPSSSVVDGWCRTQHSLKNHVVAISQIIPIIDMTKATLAPPMLAGTAIQT